MMKNRFAFKVSTFLVVTMVMGYTYSCNLDNLKKKYAPDIRLLDVNLAGFDFNGADIDFKYEMTNKAPVSITFSRLAFKIFVEGKQLISADNPKNVQVKSKGKSNFNIRHRIVYTEFAKSLIDLYKKNQVNVGLDGKVGVVIPVPGLKESVEVPIKGSKVIPMPKLPKISFKSLKYKKASLNPFNPRATFALNFNVANSNKFLMDLSSIKYNFTAANAKIVDGSTKSVQLKSGQQKELSVPVNLRGKDIIKLVPKLRDLSNQKYNFNGEINMRVAGQTIKMPYSMGN